MQQNRYQSEQSYFFFSEITNLFRLSFNQMIVDTFYKNSGEQIE